MKKIGRTDMERILILCAAALVVVLALRGSDAREPQILYETDMGITQTAAQPAVETQPTTVYYQDGEGYLVPVTVQIPKTEGVAKATLQKMVKASQNDMEAARLGLRTVIPEGTTFDLDISGGKARVDMSKEALSCMNAEEEALMVQAVASTLTCFDTVEEVSFLFGGQARSKLTHGTDVSGVFNGDYVNMESVSTSALAHADQVQLFFPSQTGRVLVPVTRTVFSDADLPTALLELAKGPREDSGLERPLPKDCAVRNVTVKNGTATIDFSKGFMDVIGGSDGGRQAIRAILFTASRFPGIQKVEILVDGQKVELPKEATATFINEATEVMSQYPGIVEID